MGEILDLLLGLSGLVITAVVLVMTGYLSYIMLFQRERLPTVPGYAWLCWLARGFEVPSLAFVTCLCISVAMAMLGSFDSGNNEPVTFQLYRLVSNPFQLLGAFVFIEFALPLLGALLAIRWIPSRPAAIWVALMVLVGGVALVFFRYQRLFAADVLDDVRGDLFDLPTFFIPMRSMWAVRTLDFVPPIVAAVVAYSLVPRWWMFFLGGGLAALGVQHLANPEFRLAEPMGIAVRDWKLLATGTATSLVILSALWCLPGQRKALLRAAGLDADSAGDDGPIASGLARLGRGVALAVALAVPVFLSAMARLDSDVVDQLVRGPRPLVYSPALQNAWVPMREHFVKESATEKTIRKMTTLRSDRALNNYCFDRRDRPEEIAAFQALLTPEVRAMLASDEAAIVDVIAAFDAAGRSDYLSPYDDDVRREVSYIMLRELARWLALRSRIRAIDGDWQGALDDISLLHRYTALDVDHILVTHMIHAAVRGIATDATTFYWQAFRDDREAMQALADALDQTAAGNRRTFPIESIRRHEPGLRAVVPMAEIIFPGMLRAHAIYTREAGNFDALRMAAALELHRLDKGEYPATLDALLPEYMPRIPLDPFDGKPWHYAVESDRLVLETERYREAIAGKQSFGQLYEPPSLLFPVAAAPTPSAAAAR